MKNLSIITINLNNADGLERTIESVLNQTYNDYEYIIIDGASNDKSVEIIKKYSHRVTHWISEKDSGIYNAMNKGIKLANGKYCQFLNSGDLLFDNNTLSNIFKSSHNDDIIYGNIMFNYMNGITLLAKMPRVITLKNMIRSTIWHPGSFIKRSLFNNTGFT